MDISQDPQPERHPDDLKPEEVGRAPEVTTASAEPAAVSVAMATPPAPPAPPAQPAVEEPDDDDEGMLRMSFLEHLEELRIRIIRALTRHRPGLCRMPVFCRTALGRRPAAVHLCAEAVEPRPRTRGHHSDGGVQHHLDSRAHPGRNLRRFALGALSVLGLHRSGAVQKERRLATPFILSCAGLFILGGLFAYFVAFRFGLTFLLSIGPDAAIKPMISVTEYFDLFVNVILGVAVVFELPVLIFFLTLLRLASPRFLLKHSRYAILLITIAAAIITPTPDVVNLAIFATPMILLYFAGVFASYLLVLSREGRRFPWRAFIIAVLLS